MIRVYCIFLSTFCLLMYRVSESVQFETGGNHSGEAYILATCDVTHWLVPDVSKTLGITSYKPERHGFDSRRGYWNFSLT
jgi:hypothetical protein